MPKSPDSKTIKRTYVFSFAELKKLLGIEGDELTHVVLWQGRTGQQFRDGETGEVETWQFTTREGDDNPDSEGE